MSGDCGTTLYWGKPCAEWSLQKNASKQITVADMEPVVSTAFNAWMTAACPGGGSPRILVTEAAIATCDLHEYNQNRGNANIFLFHDDKWPYEGSNNTLALTTVTYNLDSGEIYDADMEINSADNHFTTGDTNVDFYLPSILTHETGHFLGLAHSQDAHATMFVSYAEHTTTLRKLSDDDIAGICAIYPPGSAVSNCDPTPRHGFSPLCAADQPAPVTTPTTGCSSATPGDWTGSGGMAAALGMLVLAARRARDKRRRGG